ncbi:hypothetical protein [Achromobacter spanius]|uniref:hypothetical protein n=1 Tax=Achromobacter spanius TaxID=217203 RepID=UPI003A8F1B03
MTNQNNAAQPGLTDDEINAACGRHAADTGWHAENDRKKARAVESALLSKLRAEGVQAGAPMIPSDALDALRDFKLTVIQDGFHKIGKPMIQQLAQAGALESLGFGKHRVTEYGEWLLSSSRAALASAPVARLSAAAQASQNGCRCVMFGEGNPHWPCRLHPSAPVAGEAQPVAWAITVPKEVSPVYWSRSEEHANEKLPDYPDGTVRRVFLDAAPQASAEPLARYCPGCGSVGPVGDEYRDCCPDGNQARMIPARLAEQCRDTFRLAIQTLLADAAANDRAAPQASATIKQPLNVAPQANETVTVEMIQAGAKAARECFERTGGNDPAVIYRAMRAAVPATPPRRPSDDGQASWAGFIAWHKRHFGTFNPVCPSHNDRLIGWQAGTNSARSRLDNQTPPPSNGRTEALHG